jgi:hypothetical protein
MPATAPLVAPALGGPVTDLILDQMIDISDRLPDQPISDAEAALMLITMPGICRELRDYRQRTRLAASILDPVNVITFPGGR